MITFTQPLTIDEFTDLILGSRTHARVTKSLLDKIDLTTSKETFLQHFHVETLTESTDVRLWILEDWQREAKLRQYRNGSDITEQIRERDKLKQDALNHIKTIMHLNDEQATTMLETILSTASFARQISQTLNYSFDRLITTHRRLEQEATLKHLTT